MKKSIFFLNFIFYIVQLNADVLKFGLPNEIKEPSLYGPGVAQSKYILKLIYEPLVYFNSEHEIEPFLAKSWKIDFISKSIIFEIKKDHKFSDGSFVTAKDVVNSLSQSCMPFNDSKKDFSTIENCGTYKPKIFLLNENLIKINFLGYPSLLLYELAGLRAGISKLNSEGNKYIGSGPFQIESVNINKISLIKNKFSLDVRIRESRNLEFYFIGESNIQKKINELNLDGTIMFRLSEFNKEFSGYTLVESSIPITMALIPNFKKYPFNNKKFRQDFGLYFQNNIEFKACNKNFEPAYGVIPSGIGGSIVNHFKSNIKRSYNIKYKYQKLITIGRHIGRRDDCEEGIILNIFKKMGLKATIRYYDNYDSLNKAIKNNELSSFIEIYLFANKEAFTILKKFLVSKDNLSNTNSNELDLIWDKIWGLKTSSERYKMYQEYNSFLLREGYVYPLYYSGHRNLLKSCITNISESFSFDSFSGLIDLKKDNSKCN